MPIALLAQHARGEGLRWLAEQTYLAPYPAALGPGRALGREPGRDPGQEPGRG